MAPADPLVICLEDMGRHGINAEVYSLSQAIGLAADYEQGDHPWRITSVRYLDRDDFGQPVEDFEKLVAEELAERE